MKKVLAIVAIVMLVPFTAFGMQMMADTALDDVTGQAGVSISIDNVQMDFQMGYLGWGDSDGIDFPDTGNATLNAALANLDGGWVYLSQMSFKNIVIDKYIVGKAGIGAINRNLVANNPADLSAIQTTPFLNSHLSPLTIDVGQAYSEFSAPTGSEADPTQWAPNLTGNFVTAVVIGVPTLTIYVGEIAPFDISLVAYAPELDSTTGDPTGNLLNTPVAPNENGSDTLGTMAMGAIQLDTKGGTISIFAH